MPGTTPKSAPAGLDDDGLTELPPMDGDEADEAVPRAEPDDVPDDTAEEGLDDSTGEGDPVESDDLEVDEADRGWLEEPADNPDLDLGDSGLHDLASEVAAPDDAEEPGVKGEDFGFGDRDEHEELDAGDEGPVAADEELREEDLPQLDADEEGDVDEASLFDPGFAAEEPGGLAWAGEPWSRVGAPVPLVSATAVACAGRGALAAGVGEGREATLVGVDLEGTAQASSPQGLDVGRVRALAVHGRQVAALVEGGSVLLSSDAGGRFVDLPWARSDFEASEIAWAGERLWVRSRHGALRSGTARGVSPEAGVRAGDPRSVVALAGDRGEQVVALVSDDASTLRGVLRARIGASDPLVLEDVDGRSGPEPPAVLAARGPHLAYVGEGGVVRRLGSGAWSRHAWEGRITALAFLDDAGALVAATYAEGDDTTALVRLDAAGGPPRVVARIGPSHGASSADDLGDGRVTALAYDDTKMVLWVAGGFGVAAFAVR